MSIWQTIKSWFGVEEPAKVKLERRINKKGEYYFAIEGRNGETMMVSETYSSKYSCDRARDNMLALIRPGFAIRSTGTGAE